MSLKSKEKSVADTGAYEHLVALPNRSARRLPQNGAGRFAYPGFQRATNTPAHWAPPDWTMTEAGPEFKFCCRNDSSAVNGRPWYCDDCLLQFIPCGPLVCGNLTENFPSPVYPIFGSDPDSRACAPLIFLSGLLESRTGEG